MTDLDDSVYPTEVWWRHPYKYAKHLIETGQSTLIYHKAQLIKYRVDPLKWARITFGDMPWRLLVVEENGVAEYNQTSKSLEDSVACYPIWLYGDPMEELEAYLEVNVAEVDLWFDRADVGPHLTIKEGQEHRVFVANLPSAATTLGVTMRVQLGQLQEANRQAILHNYMNNSLRASFAYGFGSIDYDPSVRARTGCLEMPNGSHVYVKDLDDGWRQWVNVIGMSVGDDYSDVDTRMIFNIRSAIWASQNFRKHLNFRARSDGSTSPTSRPTNRAILSRKTVPELPSDKIACDHCSLTKRCKWFRAGSICSIPGSEMAALERFFKTRDSEVIINGLQELLAIQVGRIDNAVVQEEIDGKLDPNLTKLLSEAFAQGVKLAKLVNPTLAAASAPQMSLTVQTGGQLVQVQAANPKALIANVVAELEGHGIPRDQITPEMVLRVASGDPIQEIKSDLVEAEVIEVKPALSAGD